MPLFEFKCLIHNSFEVRVPFSEGVPKDWPCPKKIKEQPGICGRLSLRKLTPPAAVIVKNGTGARKSG